MSYDAIVLFSGGLDSILAAKVLEAQGLSVLCLHCVSPFFGDEASVARWSRIYELEIETLDVGREFVEMLCKRPPHGVGKALNPCVDCKILLLQEAKKFMFARGAKFAATGEVLGQRPMSQRRDALFLISREARMRDWLLRPLCARHLPPTPMEEKGIVDREKLLDLSGRGRTAQLELARKFGLTDIPSPAGGCRLTEKENARRYWRLLQDFQQNIQNPVSRDFDDMRRDFTLANIGRQVWNKDCWLSVGRDKNDNARLLENAGKNDALLKLCDFSGPISLAHKGASWPAEILARACAYTAACSSRAAESRIPVRVSVKCGSDFSIYEVIPSRNGWDVPSWDECRPEIGAWGHDK